MCDGATGTNALDLGVALPGDAPDEYERQMEMIDGLRQLATVAAGDLPRLATQHRVIGDDVCHLIAPASLPDRPDGAGKLFLTERRLVFASGGTPLAWPWHRLVSVTRVERDVVAQTAGAGVVLIRCNTYGDALVAVHLAGRLRAAARPAASASPGDRG